MADKLEVTGSVKDGVVVLALDYGRELLLREDAPKRLSEELMRRYKELQDKEKPATSSTVVEIKAKDAGSPVVRALFELWKEVVGNRGGQVVCASYPQDYIDSLTTLGLPALPGFSLAATVSDALRRVAQP